MMSYSPVFFLLFFTAILRKKLCSRTLIWDPVAALEKGAVTESTTSPDVFETILDQIPCNKREGALFLLAERGYDPTDFLQIVQDAVKPTDGSEWSDKQRKDFSYHVFRSRKDLSSVCKALDITMHSCLLYYYGEFKHTDDYRFVKTICNDESAAARSSRQFEAAQDACAVCDDGGSLVICDGCEGEYHIECLRPPLKSVPEGHWECDECVDRKVLAVHDFLIRTTALFQRDTTGKATVAANALEGGDGDGADDAKKRNSSDGAEDSLLASPSSDKMGFRPTAASVASIRKLAGSISEMFTCVPNEPKEGDAAETSTNRMDVETAEDENGRSEDV
jgi:PHD-finger